MNLRYNKESDNLIVEDQKALSKDDLYSRQYLNTLSNDIKELDSFEQYEYNPSTIFFNGKQIDIF